MLQPIGKAMAVTYSDATEEEKDKATKELMDPKGTFIARMGLLDKFVVSAAAAALHQEPSQHDYHTCLWCVQVASQACK